ncbi:hypothetical protein AMTRI_Chr13g86810 [Amborella trichopoda]
MLVSSFFYSEPVFLSWTMRITILEQTSNDKDKGRPLPKFGEWAVNDAASAEGFTVIFNKGRDEKKTGGNPCCPESPGQDDGAYKHGSFAKSNSGIWKSTAWRCGKRFHADFGIYSSKMGVFHIQVRWLP